nr:PTS cellobiose transporter subunit IIB [uncultured Enterobacter sp.]
MKKLLICCIYGVTATSLAKKMQHIANDNGYALMVSAVGLENFASVAPAFDAFLVAPHVQYKLDELKQSVPEGSPVMIIEGYPYASIDADKILANAMEQMSALSD